MFSFSGLVSGLNTTDIVSKLMSLERAPLDALNTTMANITAKDQAYSDISTKFGALQAAAQSLQIPTNVNAKTATSSSPSVLTAVANATAVNGSFSVLVNRLATATSVTSGGATTQAAIGLAVNQTAVLNSAGLANAVTAGTFSINGKTISIDPTVDTMSSIVSKINGAGAGVTASIANDQYGRANVLQVKSNTVGQAVQLGAGADTSNFLSAVGLVANGTDTVNSQMLGVANSASALSSERLVTPVAASGTFSINGVSINWTNTDTLQTVLSRINNAGAGVTAAYDQSTDRVTLTNSATGNQAISLSDTSGNFLQSMGLISGGNSVAQTSGQTASYSVNGGATQYSNSNSVQGPTGVTLTLLATQTGTPVTVTVGQDTSTTSKNLQTFVDAFNQLTDSISKYTAWGAAGQTPSPTAGDPSLLNIDARVRRFLSSPATGVSGQYQTLADIGVSTGAYGAALYSTNHLVIDQTKLGAALSNNSGQVQAVVSGVMSSLTTYMQGISAAGGVFDSEHQSFTSQQYNLNNQITNMQALLDQRQQALQQQFLTMEQTLAQLQGQSSQLTSSLSGLTSTSSTGH